MSALSVIRVIDLTSHIAGPYCTMILADLGADVIKVERPEIGDETRGMPPFVNGEGAPFMQVNRNKRSIVLDLKSPACKETCLKLIDKADVLVENYRPGTAERLGFGYDALSKRNPRLVYCSISGFGQTGPYKDRGGFDLIAQAMSGLMSICGEVDGPPFRLPIPVGDLTAGMFGAHGVLAALVAREKSGNGQAVDVSLFESALSLGVYEAAEFLTSGKQPERLGQAHRTVAPYEVFETADGWIVIGVATQALWKKFCALINAPDLLTDARFVTNAERVENHVELATLISEHLRQRNSRDWLEALDDVGIPAGPVLTHDRALSDPHTLAREMVADVHHPIAGDGQVLGIPVKLSATPGRVKTPAPTLGQHTDEILAEIA